MGAMANGNAAPISMIFAKQTSSQLSPRWLAPVVVVILASSFVIYMFFSRIPHVTKPPLAIAISACPAVASGVYRITSDFGIRFDASEEVFTVHAVVRDMPPGTLYVVKLKDADANMAVWSDDDIFRDLKTAYPVFSEHVEERNIRDATGRISGTDRWGYLQSGERWRYVRFSRGDAAGYKPTPPKQANLLDQVVNSACFSRDEP
jgi:hypothetical protein